jgi:hypothetical protein
LLKPLPSYTGNGCLVFRRSATGAEKKSQYRFRVSKKAYPFSPLEKPGLRIHDVTEHARVGVYDIAYRITRPARIGGHQHPAGG